MKNLVSAPIDDSSAVTHLLLAVDTLEYAQAVADSFQQVSKTVSVNWTNSAQECVDTLRAHKEEGGAPPPDLLILGLEKSDRSSLEILKFIREDDALRKLPVVIVSWSDDEDVIRSFYELRCNTYVQSCEDRVEMLRKVRTTCDYWLTVATLPSKARGQ